MADYEVSAPSFDVAVVGAGTVGLTLAIGLARAGFATALIGPPGASRPGRTVALLAGSVRLLDSLGLWPALVGRAAPLAHMRIVDATGSLFRTAPIQFDATEIGFSAFGFNIPNDDLDTALADATLGLPNLTAVSTLARGFRFATDQAVVEIAGGGSISARLVVAADGRNSLARKTARIGVTTHSWPQVALTALLRHQAPHRNLSTEFHTRQGPFTLVPLPDAADGTHRSSLVWVMGAAEARRRQARPELFASLVEEQAERLLGAMMLESAIGAFPLATSVSARLTGERLVLTGEAAHALPPIGAQGLNLSLRDVAALIDALSAAHRTDADIGAAPVLERYAAARRGDVAMRRMAVDALNGSLLAHSPIADLARGLGLTALGAFGPLRRALMRRGLVAGAGFRPHNLRAVGAAAGCPPART